MNVCIFSKCFPPFFCFEPYQTRKTSDFLLDSPGSQNSWAQVAWTNKPMAYIYIPIETKQARRNCERTRDQDVKFIHFISIATTVYNDDIKHENPTESLETSNNNFQNCPMYGIVNQCQDSTSDSPQISASLHQLDFALMLQIPTMLNGMPRGSSMISTCCI